MKNLHLTPLPEAITGNAWSVKNGPGSVDLTKNQMFIPTGNNAGDHFVRLHEMAHARFTPKMEAGKLAKKHGVSLEALQVCEDARIHAKLIQLREGMAGRMTGILSEEEALNYATHALMNRNPARELGRVLVGSLGTGDHHRLHEAVRKLKNLNEKELEKTPPADSEKREKLAALRDACENAIENVGTIREKCYYDNRRRRKGPAPLDFKKITIPAARLFDALFPVNPSKILDPHLKGIHQKFNRHYPGQIVPWAEMTGPFTPALTRNINARKLGKTHRATDAGANPRNLHRMAVDGAIFSTRKKIVGGTLLLDASGSMEINTDEIESFIDAVPHGRVAIYAGNDDRTGGSLVIVAEKGRAISSPHLEIIRNKIGRRNLVDGPALRWLAKQPGKKAWVSDGYVTGEGEKTGANLIEEVSEICTAHKIDRFENLEEAAISFKKGGR